MTSTHKRILAGMVVGLAGAAAMKASLWLWHSVTGNKLQHGAFGLDDEADIEGARQFCRLLGAGSLTRRQAKNIGVALHYGFGAASGAAYASLAKRYPAIRLGFGTAFGTFVWLFGDEVAVSAADVSDPLSKSASSHIAACAAHLLFGAVLESGIKHLDGPNRNLRVVNPS